MGILQNIPRKQGAINPHPYRSKVLPHVFGPRGHAGANVGDATNPGNPSYLTAVGLDYNNRLSHTGASGINPVGSHSDTATGLYYPPLVSNHVTDVVTQDQAKDVGLHERGKFFGFKPSKTRAERVSGGVDPNSNTPFHPKTTPVFRQLRFPVQPGERKQLPSFLFTKSILRGVAQNDGNAGRWNTVKRTVVDHPAAVKSTGAQPSTDSAVNSSKPVTVAHNAHSGSPYVVPWIPNARGVQPNEKGNTNPIQQPCRGLKGC